MNKSDLKAQYLAFYKAADEILRQPDNPCELKQVDGKVTCVISRRDPSFKPDLLCCEGCPHHSEAGCTVQSLWCKLGWCYGNRFTIQGMTMEVHPTFSAIYALRREAVKAGIPMYERASLEQNLEDIK